MPTKEELQKGFKLGEWEVLPSRREFHRGGTENIFPHSLLMWLRRRTLLYWAWRQLPDPLRGRLRIAYEHWNVRKTPSTASIPLTGPAYESLRAHFAPDVHLLSQISGTQPGWAETYSRQG